MGRRMRRVLDLNWLNPAPTRLPRCIIGPVCNSREMYVGRYIHTMISFNGTHKVDIDISFKKRSSTILYYRIRRHTLLTYVYIHTHRMPISQRSTHMVVINISFIAKKRIREKYIYGRNMGNGLSHARWLEFLRNGFVWTDQRILGLLHGEWLA